MQSCNYAIIALHCGWDIEFERTHQSLALCTYFIFKANHEPVHAHTQALRDAKAIHNEW